VNISCPQLSAEVGLQGAFGPNELYISSVLHHPLVLFELEVRLPVDVGETPLFRNDDLLATWKLVAGTAESLLDDVGVGVLATDGQKDLTNIDPGDGSVRLTPSPSHASLEPISTGAGQHLVDAEDVEGVDADPQMEGILSGGLGDVLVGTDTSSFKCLARELFVFVGDKVSAEGEVVDGSALSTQVEDPDLGIRDAPVVSGLGIRFVLAVTVAASWAASHLDSMGFVAGLSS